MKKTEVLFGVLKVPLDALAVLCALVLAYFLRAENIDLIPGVQLLTESPTLPTFSVFLTTFIATSVSAFLLIAAGLRLYQLKVTISGWHEMTRIVIAAGVWLAMVIAWYFLVEKELFYSRLLLIHGTLFIALFVAFERTTLLLIQRTLLRHGIGTRTVASIGKQELPMSVARTLTNDPRYVHVGHVESTNQLREIVERQHVDLVLHTDANAEDRETIRLIEYCRSQHIGYAFLPTVLTDVPHQLRIYRFGLVPILRFEPTTIDGWGRVIKRAFDLIMSAVLIVLLSPILLIIGLLVLLTSGKPVFYISKRIGQHARTTVPVLKFRTMVKNADTLKSQLKHMSHRDDGPLFKVKNDPRVTSIGKILRRFSLDELPQLFNVFVGQMSLVGPRPHLPEEVDRYTEYQRRVFAVKPGITGFAQIAGRSDLKFDEEVRLDLRYVEEWSLLTDLWILWRTLFVVLLGGGAD